MRQNQKAAFGLGNPLFTKQDIRQLTQRFDILIYLSDKFAFKAAKKLLKLQATFVSMLPPPQGLLLSFIHNLFSSKRRKTLIMKPTAAALITLATLDQKHLAGLARNQQ